MAKIFYLGGGTPARGMLRAIVTPDQLQSLLSPDSVTHLGHEFPTMSETALTVLEISGDEGTATWPAGFFRVDATPIDFDGRLRFLPEPFLPEPKKSPERTTPHLRWNGSALIHWLTRDMRSRA